MTALDMSGVSITLLKLTDASLALLDAPTSVEAWPRSTLVGRDCVVQAPQLPKVEPSPYPTPSPSPPLSLNSLSRSPPLPAGPPNTLSLAL